MLKRDFIMVQIEELGKVIALIIFNRNSNDGARKNPELIQSVYTSLKLDNDFLLNTPIDGIRTYLDTHVIEGIVFWKDGQPQCKIKRKDFGFPWGR